GSLFLGFSLSLTAVLLTQGSNTSVDSMFPVLVLLLPIFDTLRVLTVRLLNGKNPFRGDNLHLHFLIMEKNISPVYVTFIFWSMTALFGGVALSLTNNTSMSYLTFVLFASLLLGLFAFSLTQRQHIRREARTGSPLPAETGAYSSGLTRHHTFGFGFTRNEEIVRFKWIVTMGVLLLPAQTIGQTDCWYYEYPDHYMAVCDGDERAGAVPPHSAVTVQPALNPDSQSTGNRSDKSLKSAPSSYSESTTRTPSSAHEAQQQGTRREGFVDKSAPLSPGKDIVLTEVKPQANGRKSEVYPSMYRPPRSILNRLQSE
ncbi:MAG: hypothetical protein WCD00_04405, partial [Desulfuromonadaceae bacterium]